MEELTTKFIKEESEQAYKTAKEHGFFDHHIDIATQMMLIVTEMAEAVQADRKNNRGFIEDLEASKQTMTFEEAYKETLEDTVESEFADIAIRILSFLGWENSGYVVEFLDNKQIYHLYNIYKYKFRDKTTDVPRGMFTIISNCMRSSDFYFSPSWIIANILQDVLCQVYALALHLDIDLLLHIRLKMQYNKSREYKHGRKY